MVLIPNPSPFPVPGHNHGPCVDTAVRRAAQAFDEHGLKLTALRLKILREIASSHHAVGAYDILDRLARKGERMAPISVYRAIDALLAAGVVHRLESRNAFFACHVDHAHTDTPVIIACETCSVVAEVDGQAIFRALTKAAEDAQFKVHRRVVEITGLCRLCQSKSAAVAGVPI